MDEQIERVAAALAERQAALDAALARDLPVELRTKLESIAATLREHVPTFLADARERSASLSKAVAEHTARLADPPKMPSFPAPSSAVPATTADELAVALSADWFQGFGNHIHPVG